MVRQPGRGRQLGGDVTVCPGIAPRRKESWTTTVAGDLDNAEDLVGRR
ncbi:MAG: hypothetical protein IH885_08195 [Myxococcales bacterium]|nr:hypothetical protein [Myxococcales bacterium]